MKPVAALPMYDWPEVRDETDAEWRGLRERLLARGVDAPETLIRSNDGLPAVPGGITSEDGTVIAPDPAELPPGEFDFHTLWRHPDLLLAQTCWAPMELGLADHARVVGQPDYSSFDGGDGIYYRSAILVRRRAGAKDASVPDGPGASFDAEELARARFTFNGADSMSGLIALRRDLAAAGAIAGEDDFGSFWSSTAVSGGHRQSVRNIAEGTADVATIDCRTLDLCHRFEPSMSELRVAGWTARRKGLPYIAAPAHAQPISLSSQ